MRRVHALLPTMEAQDVLRLPAGALRAAGLSERKVEYVEKFLDHIDWNEADMRLRSIS